MKKVILQYDIETIHFDQLPDYCIIGYRLPPSDNKRIIYNVHGDSPIALSKSNVFDNIAKTRVRSSLEISGIMTTKQALLKLLKDHSSVIDLNSIVCFDSLTEQLKWLLED